MIILRASDSSKGPTKVITLPCTVRH